MACCFSLPCVSFTGSRLSSHMKGLKARFTGSVTTGKGFRRQQQGEKTLCTEFLEKEGIKTLLFAGVNTDQCVSGSLQGAFTKGRDCVLLSDGAGTISPDHSQESIEFNCAKTWGFCMECEDFAKGVEDM